MPMMTPTGALPGGLPSMTALGSKTVAGVRMFSPYYPHRSLPGACR
jgi:hypothetical protein